MLIYCANLYLDTTFADILDTMAEWVGRKLAEEHLTGQDLARSGTIRRGERWAEVAVLTDEYPYYQAIRYTQPDSGRQWITEIGMQQDAPDRPVACSVLLETNEISMRVEAPLTITRPYLVRQLMTGCHPVSPTPGYEITPLDEHNAAEIKAWIEARSRRSPIVIVSPTVYGRYLTKIDDVHFQLAGIADIVQLTCEADSHQVNDVLGRQYGAWNGSVILIYPPFQYAGQQRVYTRRFSSEQVEFGPYKEEDFAHELLSLVAHRLNPLNYRHHISLQRVEDERRKREQQRSEVFVDEYTRSLQQDIQRLEDENAILEQMNAELEEQLQEKNDELQRQEAAFGTSLQYQRGQSNRRGWSERFEQTLLAIAEPTPEQALTLIAEAFRDRLVILESAWESARESESFAHRNRLLGLLWKLATVYWETLSQGGSDQDALAIFGESFSAKESESTEKNRSARAQRTFEYQGEDIVMPRHLKIGVKDSLVDTIRVHFHWDAENAKIVIGHCGQHLYIPGR